MLKKIYSATGHGACIIKDGKIADVYLLSDEEVELMEKFCNITSILPEKFRMGVFTYDDTKVVILRNGSEFICFPTKKENIMEIIRDVEVNIYDKILSPENR
ncbi:hypothetical protein [Archaeoglobus neptunius]|uniref:hypothetical protein n=1 Tax=Archaeoglobus neptunius TaxID=2798580 RepID=UPI0019257592|nr:hypothetical protein [Archaeoglobus neptunius]